MEKRLAFLLSMFIVFSSAALAQTSTSTRHRAVGFPPPPLTGGAAVARQLATRISQAGTDEERTQVLLDVMRAFNVGVYKSSGDAVVRGAERGPLDFYLYDIEVAMMSTSLGRQDSSDVSELAATLTEMGILPDDKPISPDQLRNILLTVTREAFQSPDDRYSLLPLLVRELGLRRATPYDMLDNVPIENLTFNALQKFLIIADIVLPILREVGPAATRSNLDTGGILKTANIGDQNACDSIVGTAIKEGWDVGKFLILAGNEFTKLAQAIIDGIHGSVLAFSVEVRAVSKYGHNTHYGHTKPGNELRFSILVNMRDELPELVIKCGWLYGVEFPKKGPIAGVKMLWQWAPTVIGGSDTRNLDEHGEIICDAQTCKQTGPDGIATLVFKPKMERQPVGVGLSYDDEGLVTGLALYQSRHKNYLGSVNQIITPKYGTMFWDVSYHQEPEFKLEFTSSITGTTITSNQAQSNARSTVDLQFDESKGYTGNGALSYQTVPLTQACDHNVISGQGTTTLLVANSEITGDLSAAETPKIQLVIVPGFTMETLTFTSCPPQVVTLSGPTSFWTYHFYAGHIMDYSDTKGGFEITNWTYVGQTSGGVFAQAHLFSTCDATQDIACLENTDLVLKLKPQPPPPGHPQGH
jgi:hypothetical protein